MCVCVCACVCVERGGRQERKARGGGGQGGTNRVRDKLLVHRSASAAQIAITDFFFDHSRTPSWSDARTHKDTHTAYNGNTNAVHYPG